MSAANNVTVAEAVSGDKYLALVNVRCSFIGDVRATEPAYKSRVSRRNLRICAIFPGLFDRAFCNTERPQAG